MLESNVFVHWFNQSTNMPLQFAFPFALCLLLFLINILVIGQIEIPNQPIYFWIFMKMCDIGVMRACVQNLHQRPIHGFFKILENGSSRFDGLRQQWLDAVLGDVTVRVLLHLFQKDVQVLRCGYFIIRVIVVVDLVMIGTLVCVPA